MKLPPALPPGAGSPSALARAAPAPQASPQRLQRWERARAASGMALPGTAAPRDRGQPPPQEPHAFDDEAPHPPLAGLRDGARPAPRHAPAAEPELPTTAAPPSAHALRPLQALRVQHARPHPPPEPQPAAAQAAAPPRSAFAPAPAPAPAAAPSPAVAQAIELQPLIESCCRSLYVGAPSHAVQAVLLELGPALPGCTVEIVRSAGAVQIRLRGVQPERHAELQNGLGTLADDLARRLGCAVVAAVEGGTAG